MKGRGRLVMFFFLFLCSVLATMGVTVYAESDEWPEIEPNQYQRQDIELRTDYLHEESLLDEKGDLPETQTSLTFQGPASSFFEQTKAQLFLSEEKETNTIAAKAEKLGLFSFVEEQSIPSRQPMDEAERTSSSFLPWLFGFFILGFLIVIFTVIVPRMKKFVS
ncbi:type VII secretion protein EssA [Thermaerobacillus caldiproteolyticus]|uniref:Type VII secretion protein EssA n=1 Tax=Thermaerobacillus caldiproteolyticus TaxID=247480 RepID=A0A7V9Z840_9BACL|nr:type VII secretion protein EssA [Anoxybacillus caldiproteolyticus]MBA2875700.1 type VII secretion protein EssA [Anoxybacillus caldiproteolyticus]